MEKNLILIGMPGAGKSTIGVVLAKILGKAFVDTDLLIQQRENRLLQQIIDEDGVERFLAVEAKTICETHFHNTVIATGGSAVYSRDAIEHLKANGVLVYLQLPYEVLETRITDMGSRGIAMKQGERFIDLFRERAPLYEKYADYVIDGADFGVEELARQVAAIWDHIASERGVD